MFWWLWSQISQAYPAVNYHNHGNKKQQKKLWENPLFLWPCSIAMLVYQGVVLHVLGKSISCFPWMVPVPQTARSRCQPNQNKTHVYFTYSIQRMNTHSHAHTYLFMYLFIYLFIYLYLFRYIHRRLLH